ncbi:hypothetical protein [Desulfovibrio cuneatus]|uniref:hypothetical protein n=1 Tax=Desulfovibrio cuneatus TaxID=159728 RepID=UPI0004856F1B|nr:hypothetical protein [Desulfovibrio cuneatus]
MENTIFNILISSAVIVAALTGIFNVIISFSNNRNIRKIESQKAINDLIKYRYTTLHANLSEITNLEDVTFDLSDSKREKDTVSKVSERFNKIEKKYKLIKPLLDSDLSKEVDVLYGKATAMSNELVEHIYAKKNIDFELKDFLITRQELEQKIVTNVQLQLQRLLLLQE